MILQSQIHLPEILPFFWCRVLYDLIVERFELFFQHRTKPDVDLLQHQIGQPQRRCKVEVQAEGQCVAAAPQCCIPHINKAERPVGDKLHHPVAAVVIGRDAVFPAFFIHQMPLDSPARTGRQLLEKHRHHRRRAEAGIVTVLESPYHKIGEVLTVFAYLEPAKFTELSQLHKWHRHTGAATSIAPAAGAAGGV